MKEWTDEELRRVRLIYPVTTNRKLERHVEEWFPGRTARAVGYAANKRLRLIKLRVHQHSNYKLIPKPERDRLYCMVADATEQGGTAHEATMIVSCQCACTEVTARRILREMLMDYRERDRCLYALDEIDEGDRG